VPASAATKIAPKNRLSELSLRNLRMSLPDCYGRLVVYGGDDDEVGQPGDDDDQVADEDGAHQPPSNMQS
jgi:hypothetical protein